MTHGCHVFGLTPSVEAAERVRRLGAIPVMGDLLEPGQWQDEAAADWVFHLPTSLLHGRRMTRRRASSIARAQVSMDAHLLDAVARARPGGSCTWRTPAGTARRARVPSPRTNRPGPPPGGAASVPRSIASMGTSSPGCRSSPRSPGASMGTPRGFANASSTRSWPAAAYCSLARPDRGCRPFTSTTVLAPCCTLPSAAKSGGRYFLVNRDPVLLHELAETFARLANRPLRVRRVPAGSDAARGRSRAGRLRAVRRGVLEHPAPRDWLPLSVSHARGGIPPSPRGAP